MKNEIHLTGNQESPLIILEGKALEQKYSEKISITGNIKSIGAFLCKRKVPMVNAPEHYQQGVQSDLALVIVNQEKMSIHLKLHPENTFGAEVIGILALTPELQHFQINENKQWIREELVKFLRFNARFFDDKAAHKALLEAYQKLNLIGQTNVSAESDTRGNKNLAFQKQIDSSNIPNEFILNIPIFKGFGKERFRVEICLDATDASVRFWFESPELHELIETRRDEIFADELDFCKDFPIIFQ